MVAKEKKAIVSLKVGRFNMGSCVISSGVSKAVLGYTADEDN